MLLIDCPLLTTFLNYVTRERENETDFEFLVDAVTPVVKNDLVAANELRDIIHAVTLNGETFLDRNAAWFMCNYASKWESLRRVCFIYFAADLRFAVLTVSLHLFGILLGCKHHDTLLPESNISDVRTSLDQSLETMRIIQRTSLMSHKARRCLLGFVEVFDSFGKLADTMILGTSTDQSPFLKAGFNQQYTPSVPMVIEEPGVASMGLPSLPLDFMPENYVSQYIASSTNEFLYQGNNNDFLHSGFDFLYPYNTGSMAQ